MAQTVKLQGAVFRDPERKISKKGTAYAVATVKVGAGEKQAYWRVMGFEETVAPILELRDKQTIEIVGPMVAETYVAKDGATKLSLTCFAKGVRDWAPAQK